MAFTSCAQSVSRAGGISSHEAIVDGRRRYTCAEESCVFAKIETLEKEYIFIYLVDVKPNILMQSIFDEIFVCPTHTQKTVMRVRMNTLRCAHFLLCPSPYIISQEDRLLLHGELDAIIYYYMTSSVVPFDEKKRTIDSRVLEEGDQEQLRRGGIQVADGSKLYQSGRGRC